MVNINLFNQDLQEILTVFQKKNRSPSTIIGYSFEDYQHYESVGKIDSQDLPNSLTKFHMGNLTEIITAFCFLELIKHNPDDRLRSMKVPLIKYLPNLRIKEPQFNTKYINIVDLLTHTSGMGDYRQKWDSFGTKLEFEELTSIKKGVFKELYDKSVLQQMFISNSQWYQSPHNYGLLSYLIEELQPNSAKNFILNKLNKLKINQSSFNHNSGSNFLIPYERRKNSFEKIDTNKPLLYSSYGLVSTIGDVLDFVEILNYSFNNPSSEYHDTSNQMYSPSYSPVKQLSKVALPFIVNSIDPLILEYQSYKDSTCSKLIVMPRYKFAMILVSNSDYHNDFDILFNKIYQLFSRSILNQSRSNGHFNKNENLPIHKNIIGLYRAGQNNSLNQFNLNSFGNEISIEMKKDNLVIRSLFRKQPNNFPKLFENKGKQLKFLSEEKSSIIFAFTNNNKLVKLSFPNSDIPIYSYIETPAPIILYRLKHDNTGFRSFLLSWNKSISSIKLKIIFLLKSIKTGIRQLPSMIVISSIYVTAKLAQKLTPKSKVQIMDKTVIEQPLSIHSSSEEHIEPPSLISPEIETSEEDIELTEKSQSAELKQNIIQIFTSVKIKIVNFVYWVKINSIAFAVFVKKYSIIALISLRYLSVAFYENSKVFLNWLWKFLNKSSVGITRKSKYYFNNTRKSIKTKSSGIKLKLNQRLTTFGSNYANNFSTIYKRLESRLLPLKESISPKIRDLFSNFSNRRYQINTHRIIPIRRFYFNKSGYQYLLKLHKMNMNKINNIIRQRSELLSNLLTRSKSKLLALKK